MYQKFPEGSSIKFSMAKPKNDFRENEKFGKIKGSKDNEVTLRNERFSSNLVFVQKWDTKKFFLDANQFVTPSFFFFFFTKNQFKP